MAEVASPNKNADVERKREELYGCSRCDGMKKMKGTLTEDHIHLLVQEGQRTGNLPIWRSTTKTCYMGNQPHDRVAMSWNSAIQNSHHFSFRGDASPIDGAIYKLSLTNSDYNRHTNFTKLPVMKLDPQINLPDMNPRYWKDARFGDSFYNTDFSETIKRHIDLAPIKQASEMRRRNVKDLRSTHFQFGNDLQSFQTETGTSFDPSRPRSGIRLDPLKHPRHRRAKTEPEDMTHAAFVQKMLKDGRESYVFRDGDYNVKVPKEDISTFSRDYNTIPKPNKSAAFVEPTQIPKGRFLQDKGELREFIMEETKPWTTQETKPWTTQETQETPEEETQETPEEETVLPESTMSTLRQLFAQYDQKSTGYVSKAIMQRVLDSLLDPIPEDQVQHLLRYSQWGEDGAINYNDFIKKYKEMAPLQKPRKVPVIRTRPNASSSTPEKSPGTVMRAGASHTGPNLDTATQGKSYQTSVHFQFGTDKGKPSSIYTKDFDTEIQQDIPPAHKQAPPQSSQVMHKVPGVGFGSSSKQSSFVDFHEVDGKLMRQILDERNKTRERNKRRHDLNSVIMTCDPNRDAVYRQTSLSHCSYITHTDAKPGKRGEPHQPKYPYLKCDLALSANPHPLPKRSEAHQAFCGPNFSNQEEELATLRGFNDDNKERVTDGQKEHFKFGNDVPDRTTEARAQFTHITSTDDVVPAGKTNADDPCYPHFESSKNTLDLGGSPLTPNNIERINLAKKTCYHMSNPTDPLHIHLRQALMAMDPQCTGHVSRKQLDEIVNKFPINVSKQVLERIIDRCDKHGDGTNIDYHQIVRGLTMEIPPDTSAPHCTSLMRNDYKPTEQRSFTDAQLLTIEHMSRKPVKPQATHFFHMNSTKDNRVESMTSQDYIKPELHTS